MRSPREVVEAYNLELWNLRRYDLAPDLIADEVVRHDVGCVRTLTRAESLQRVVDAWEQVDQLCVSLLQVVAEGELVCIVYGCRMLPKGRDEVVLGSVEVFRVVDGQICEVWNAAHSTGSWL